MASLPVSNRLQGMELPTIRVNRISGPVSMYYLRPRKDIYEKYHPQGLDLPLLLLFGDVHQSSKGVCEECECSEDCCKLIYDKEFIREFDLLARETPIDFYTEYSLRKEDYYHGNDRNDILFKDFIEKTVSQCHDVELRKSKEYTEKCPTKFIRWHYGDLRFFSNRIEGMMIHPLYKYMQQIEESPYRKQYDTMRSIFVKNTLHRSNPKMYPLAVPYNVALLTHLRKPLYDEKMNDESEHENILRYLLKTDFEVSVSTEEIIGYQATKDLNGFKETIETLRQQFKEYISEKLEPYLPLLFYTLKRFLKGKVSFRIAYIRLYLFACERAIELTDEYISFITPFRMEGKSGIYKELEKQSVPELQDIALWKRMIIENTIRRYDFIHLFMIIDLYQRKNPVLFNRLFDKLEICLIDPLNDMSSYSLREYETNKEHDRWIRSLLNKLVRLLRLFNSSILDIYTITRMLKTPIHRANNGSIQKETQSTLSLGFFGDGHTRKIVSMMMNAPFYYELAYHHTRRGEKEKERCIEIQESIPLVQDVHAHHALRFEGNENDSKSNQYYSRLRKEQRHRIGKMTPSTRKKPVNSLHPLSSVVKMKSLSKSLKKPRDDLMK